MVSLFLTPGKGSIHMKEYNFQVYLLSQKFTTDYPLSQYPELMYKQGRPYTCLLIETHDNYFLCVPFRSSINHKNAYHFIANDINKCLLRRSAPWSKIDRGGGYYEHSRIYT